MFLLQLEATITFVFGLLFGSFLNVVAHRYPLGESIVFPGSHCPHCQRMLSPWELVPVFSWLFLRGRCHGCHKLVSIRYPLFELATGALFGMTVFLFPSWPVRGVWIFFWFLLMMIVATDISSMRVPNVLSLPGAAICLLASTWVGMQPLWHAVLGAATAYLLLLFIHIVSRGNMGMGDVKLFLSIGVMLGPVGSLEALVAASFSGVVIGLILRLSKLLKRRAYMPFVPHIAVGVILVACYGQRFTAWYISQFLR